MSWPHASQPGTAKLISTHWWRRWPSANGWDRPRSVTASPSRTAKSAGSTRFWGPLAGIGSEIDPSMPGDESRLVRPRLIIVTGVSGSGRASAMRVLEDLGFYCVDNLPVALAATVVKLASSRDASLVGLALGIDARERLF